MWDKTPRKSHMPCSARRQLKPVLLPLEPPGRSSNRPENQLRRMRLWRRERTDGVMAVTTAGEEEHAAIFCPIVLTSIFFKSYSQFCGMECRELHALNSLSVTAVTQKCEAAQQFCFAPSGYCRHVFPPFASLGRNHLHSDFRYGDVAVRQRTPSQEPIGDPRPQAFFFPRFASTAQ